MNLNIQQQEAVDFGEGVCQILAGAGSGKTRTLTERIVRLVKDGVDPESILSLAFNKAAATELQGRLSEALGEETAGLIWTRTFHSLGYKILGDNFSKLGFSKYPQVIGGRQTFFIRKAVEDAGLDPENDLGLFFGARDYALQNDMDSSEYASYLASIEGDRRIGAALRNYERAKLSDNLVDFDDMIFLARRALRRFPLAREKWSAQFVYVLVDEFQDVDAAQVDIVQILSAPENNLMVVGDDFQSIYAFRGADPSFTINFRGLYPDAHQIFLTKNYRSTQPIIEVSNTLIAVNLNQVKKTLESDVPSNDNVECVVNADAVSEADWLSTDVASRIKAGASPEHFAVLYRTNAQAAFHEVALMRRGIPYQVRGGFSFYSRREIKDVLAYLSLALRGDNESFERIYNKPNRFLGKAYMTSIKKLSKGSTCLTVAQNIQSYGNLFKPFHIKNTVSLCNIVRLVAAQSKNTDSVGDLLRLIVEVTKYKAYLMRDVDENDPDNDVMSNLEAFYEIADQFTDARLFIEFIEKMQNAEEKDEGGAVILSSLHRAKGLEWNVVYVVGASHGLLPHRMSTDIEEERRLMYVGLTRGRNTVRVSSLASYNGKQMRVSQFVAEAGIELQDLTA